MTTPPIIALGPWRKSRFTPVVPISRQHDGPAWLSAIGAGAGFVVDCYAVSFCADLAISLLYGIGFLVYLVAQSLLGLLT